MAQQHISFDYQLFASDEELENSFRTLVAAAREATKIAYAPYSKFYVGAALLLANGKIVKGGNQENASFPAGICAERVALSAASSLFPNIGIQAIAIAYSNPEGNVEADHILSPCGICRQSILESGDRQKSNIQVLLSSPSGRIILIENAHYLLPLAFSSSNL